MSRRQYSGNEHRVIRGIGLVSCVYVNVQTRQFWVIDYRLYDPDGDGHSKLEHVATMLNGVVYSKQLPFATVLMDNTQDLKQLRSWVTRSNTQENPSDLLGESGAIISVFHN